jgi:hypothetical protein
VWVASAWNERLSSPEMPGGTLWTTNRDGTFAGGDGTLNGRSGALLWRRDSGFQLLDDLLDTVSEGALRGWRFATISDMSGDGNVVLGRGWDALGRNRTFIISGLGPVPEPATYGIVAPGLLALLVFGRRLRWHPGSRLRQK